MFVDLFGTELNFDKKIHEASKEETYAMLHTTDSILLVSYVKQNRI